MALLQISEPGQSLVKPYALGIDLGTTNSLVSVVKDTVQVLNIDGHKTLPSVVSFVGEPSVGHAALTYLDSHPKDTIVSAKRFMGRNKGDIKFSHPYDLSGGDDTMPDFITELGAVSPVAVSAHLLAKLVGAAKEQLTGDLAGAVVTVPAYFDDAQRQATLDAAQASGIKVLRLLNEPTAAAIAYGLDDKTVLVYDLGGGTFDVSLLTSSDGVFDVKATGGNSSLGGDDIDRLLMQYILKKAGYDVTSLPVSTKAAIARLAKTYKHALSEHSTVAVIIPEFGIDLTVSQDELVQVAAPVLERTLRICQQVLDDAGVQKDSLDEILLVGGSTRMPLIGQAVEGFFQRQPKCTLNPDEVVAMGAGILANQLVSRRDNLLLLDVTPLSLGLETMGGLVQVIIPRNTAIPAKKINEFTTHADGQTGMVVHVVQGERELAHHCRSLATFELNGIPPMKAGMARVQIVFAIDVNGKLTVSAQELSTGVQTSVKVTPSSGLSQQQQEALLKEGFAFAKADKDARKCIEIKLKAQSELQALTQAKADFSDLLTDDEKHALTQAMTELDHALAQDEPVAIEQAKAQLAPLSDHFAGLIMNQNVKTALTGTTASDWQ